MGIAVPVTKSEAALARKIVIPAKSSGKPQLSLGTLKLGPHVLNRETSQFQSKPRRFPASCLYREFIDIRYFERPKTQL
jgi:hypothetical protein